ncbi:membrane protein [Helicobacter pylori]
MARREVRTGTGPGRIVVAVYAVLALAATGRSVLQITKYFDRAPLAYVLSAVAAVIYVVATVALAKGGPSGARLATGAITVEAVGVLAVGTLSFVRPELFPDKTVWSHYGSGYGYLPLVLPFVGLWWIHRVRRG